MSQSNYDKFPSIAVPDSSEACVTGWDEIALRLAKALANRKRAVVTIDCYPGVNESQVAAELSARLKPVRVIRTEEAMLSPERIDRLVAPFLGGDDPVFGFLSGLTLSQFFTPEEVSSLREKLEASGDGTILVVGVGARLIAEGDVFVYADLPRWEAQLRFRRNESSNLGVDNATLAASLQYKRAFFVDWRVADRWKRPLIAKWDFVLDTTSVSNPKLAEGEAVRRGLRHAVTRPFRVVPFFDPAPWGGQWMKEVCALDKSMANYGWCFDCVPEENSILLDIGNARIELPSVDVLYQHPRELLGESVHARFGDEFPIRFDLLDTMGGGNLSFQVHPLTEYIQHHFGMHYTQDESYYMLDAGADATVYLGLKEGIDRGEMISALRKAQLGGAKFAVQRFANRFPARKHDHFLIPAGTVHCSGSNSLVLEISATPYIFTFKMWDWGRLGLDGKPRPVHLDHGIANIQWERTGKWVENHLINRVSEITSGEGWREERTGLHEREFIETRRHWFTKPTPHHTHGGVNVLNLVEGKEAVVESLENAFEPFLVHYAETFIIPAAVGSYTIRPLGNHERSWATMKAFVR
jgi:mannose-6-phosphate isomerase class I